MRRDTTVLEAWNARFGIERPRIVFLVSGPSGVGKTTVVQRVLDSMPDLAKVVTTTSRPMRPGEKDGVHRYFVNKRTFMEMVDHGAFVEWKKQFGHLYGVTLAALQERTDQDVILDIDTRGKKDLLERVPDRVATIFLTLPGLADIRARQMKREDLSESELDIRMTKAADELRMVGEYDYAVENIMLDETVETVRDIITAERLRRDMPLYERIREELEKRLRSVRNEPSS